MVCGYFPKEVWNMNVIDLRDELYRRRIEIIEIDGGCIYYAEELTSDDEARLYIYRYDAEREEERVLSFFTLEDTDCIEHFYSCGGSIMILFESRDSKAWLIKLDKRSGAELIRKKIALIGRYFDCVPISENDLIIYTKADDENRELFNRCLETTNSDTIANLYDIEKGYRYFIKDFKTAALIENAMHSFKTAKGEEKLLLCDPYCGEAEKQEIVRALAGHFTLDGDELRDNIWLISKSKLLSALKSGAEKIPLRRAASAGVEGTVRFECISGENIIFRAKVYKTGLEQFFAMSAANGSVSPVKTVRERGDGERYFTDVCGGSIYYMTELDGRTRLEGEVGSSARMTYPNKAGRMISCIDDRYIVAEKDSDEPTAAIYDSRLHITDTFQARVMVKGATVVLY